MVPDARRHACLLTTILLGLLIAASPTYGAEPPGRLLGRAVLPADTSANGPPSGAALGSNPINGVTPPFARQPVQGFSGILAAGRGEWRAIPDNGYGRKESSADWLLRIYRVRVAFEKTPGKGGGASVRSFVDLRDPNRMLPFALVRADRHLTGADVDPESILEGPDGSFWIGDEFGPWMLHFDRAGRLLEPPVSLSGVKSPQNPELAGGEAPTLDRSKGFEAAALASNRRFAYAFLEGALLADTDQRRRFVYELDLERSRFTGRRWAYRTEDRDWLVADAKLLDDRRLLVMERDDFEGAGVKFKRVYEVDLGARDPDGFARKRELVDLLDLSDPAGISLPAEPGDRGLGQDFSFPLRSVESILPLSRGRLVVANDNNYPFDVGRHDGRIDGNEWIVVSAPPRCGGRRATIVASARDDTLVGTSGPDVILALGGDDRIRAGGGSDLVCAGSGDDRVRGGSGRDRLHGGSGRDRLRGQSGNDRLFGGRARDRLAGGDGRDRLSGGDGGDRLFGGDDADLLRGGPGDDHHDQ